MTCFIDTLSGSFDYDDPKPEQVDVLDIAASLSKTCRWRGFINGYLSVAEHAVLVYQIASELTSNPRVLLAALHHDDHEAYTADLPSPLKRKLGDWWDELVHPIDNVIAQALGLHPHLFHHPVVKKADFMALGWEAAKLKPKGRATSKAGVLIEVPLADVPPWAVNCLDHEAARAQYLDVHCALVKELV